MRFLTDLSSSSFFITDDCGSSGGEETKYKPMSIVVLDVNAQ